MKLFSKILSVFIIIYLTGCASVDVQHDYDSDYDYSSLKTYKWYEVEAPSKISELRVKRMVEALDAELNKRGYKQSLDEPDFLIALHGLTETKVNISDYGYGWGSWRTGSFRDLDVDTYEVGTVIIDFVDAESEELFWRGVGQGVVESDLSPEEQKSKYAEASTVLLSQFPPTK